MTTRASTKRAQTNSKSATSTKRVSKKATTQNADLDSEETDVSEGKGKSKTLYTLFEDLLCDTYNAEKQLLKALPKLSKAVYTDELKDLIDHHLEQSKKHVERLDKVFARLQMEEREEECEAMKGLIEEALEITKDYSMSPLRDSALVIAIQKAEHYEMAAYSALCELADVLGWQKIQDILGRTLDEEEDTIRYLTKIGMRVNDQAAETIHQEHL